MPDEFVVTPYKVSGEVDYDVLIQRFGTKAIDQRLLARLAKYGPLHPMLRRGIFFSHRDFEWILDEYDKGNKFSLYTGRGPSGPIHLGQEGEIYGLVGSDGAGKTTTMRLLVGALLCDAGDINVCGYDVRKQVEQVRSQIGYLSQRFSMYEDLTVLENIRFFAEVRGLSQTEWLPRSMEILEFVGLANFKDRRAGQLSGGMKQKLGLASALVTRPHILLLDEPTTGVDPVTRQDFWQLVIKLVSTPLAPSVIISTPYMDEASRCHHWISETFKALAQAGVLSGAISKKP